MTGSILIVDDVPTNRIVLKAKLAAAGYEPVVAPDAAAALAMMPGVEPDLVLLDLAGTAGIGLIMALRGRAGRLTPD